MRGAAWRALKGISALSLQKHNTAEHTKKIFFFQHAESPLKTPIPTRVNHDLALLQLRHTTYFNRIPRQPLFQPAFLAFTLLTSALNQKKMKPVSSRFEILEISPRSLFSTRYVAMASSSISLLRLSRGLLACPICQSF